MNSRKAHLRPSSLFALWGGLLVTYSPVLFASHSVSRIRVAPSHSIVTDLSFLPTSVTSFGINTRALEASVNIGPAVIGDGSALLGFRASTDAPNERDRYWAVFFGASTAWPRDRFAAVDLKVRWVDLEFHKNRVEWTFGADIGYRFRVTDGIGLLLALRPSFRLSSLEGTNHTEGVAILTSSSRQIRLGAGIALALGLTFGVGSLESPALDL